MQGFGLARGFGIRNGFHMATEVESLVLEHLRAIRSDVSELKEDMRDLKVRMTSMTGLSVTLPTSRSGSTWLKREGRLGSGSAFSRGWEKL